MYIYIKQIITFNSYDIFIQLQLVIVGGREGIGNGTISM